MPRKKPRRKLRGKLIVVRMETSFIPVGRGIRG
jgi:hypothetical protein